MKTIPHLVKFLAVCILSLFLLACSKNDDDTNPGIDNEIGNTDDAAAPPPPSIVELVVETEELSLLEEAVIKANLVDTLNAEGPFTVFAPTNAAIRQFFDLLGDSFSSFDDFDTSLELQILEQILLYHVVPGNITSADLSPGTVNTLLTDETLEVISNGNTFVIGDASDVDANILTPDQEANNGVVHIIDKILIPQEIQDFLDFINPDDSDAGLPTIREIVESTEELDFLAEALELTGLLETLSEEGPFTVFAPTNETITMLFALIGGSFGDLNEFNLDFEIDLLRQVLSYHVVPGIVTSNDLVLGQVTTLLPNDGFEVVSENGEFALLDGLHLPVDLLATDIPAANGVIHTIERILIPESVIQSVLLETEQNLLELIETLEHCDEFVYALLLARSHFEDVLDSEFTFFLPTNQAFLELFESLEGIDSLADFDTLEELELLAEILSYHIVPETTALANDLFNNQELHTVQGETLNILINNSVFILDKSTEPAAVTSPDIEVLDGVIHSIDKVLLPQEAINQISS
ncbi:MAG: fasciclin domain-containing protein [Bacteroidota bacterium]